MDNNWNSNSRDQFHLLLETVERLRREQYPDLDETLVREILSLHADVVEADGETARSAEQIVDRYLGREL